MIFTTNKPLNQWARYYTTKIWRRPFSIGCSNGGVSFTLMDLRGEHVISSLKTACFPVLGLPEFPEPHTGTPTENVRYRVASIRKIRSGNVLHRKQISAKRPEKHSVFNWKRRGQSGNVGRDVGY
jgi:hypothetical protein